MKIISRRTRVKIERWLRSWDKITYNINSTQHVAGTIFRLCTKSPSAELLIMPVRNKRIIKLEDRGTYLVLETGNLSITNHKFSYHVEISPDLTTRLARVFDSQLDTLRAQQEKAILNQMEIGLKEVLQTLKKKKR
jgi:hypothetical protein